MTTTMTTTTAATSAPAELADARGTAGHSVAFDVGLVADVNAGPAGSAPYGLTAAHGSLYFAARTPDLGHEPWVTNGTPDGTRLVADFTPGPHSSFLRDLTSTVGATILALDHREATTSGRWPGTLWATTTTGSTHGTTTLLKSSPLLSTAAARFDDDALLRVSNFANRAQLWRTNGTPEGTRIIRGNTGGSDLAPAGDRAFFDDWQQTLLVTDGTTTGTRRLRTWGEGPNGDIIMGPLAIAGGRAFFVVESTYASGYETWVSNGTRAGTRILKDINPGPADARPGQLTPVGRRIFFVANDGRHGREVWRSDGTPASTVRVTALGSRAVNNLTACRGWAYFATADIDRVTLWRTRGRPGHYDRVASLPGDARDHPTRMTCIAGGLAFAVDDSVHGRELWTLADGARRAVLHDLRPGGMSSRPAAFTRIGSQLFVVAGDGPHGREVWRVSSRSPTP